MRQIKGDDLLDLDDHGWTNCLNRNGRTRGGIAIAMYGLFTALIGMYGVARADLFRSAKCYHSVPAEMLACSI
jgi:hypothetical protein